MSPAKNKALKEKASVDTASNISAEVSETSNSSQKKGRGKKVQDKVEEKEVAKAESSIEKIEESKEEDSKDETNDVEMTEPKEVKNGEKGDEDEKDLVKDNIDQISGDVEKMEVDEENKDEDDKPAAKNKRKAPAKKGAKAKNKTEKLPEKEEEEAEDKVDEKESEEVESSRPTRGKKATKVEDAKKDEEVEVQTKTRQTRQKKTDEDKKVETPRSTRSTRATEEAKKVEAPKSKRGSKKVEVESEDDEEEEEEEEEEVPKAKKNDKKAPAAKKPVAAKSKEATKTKSGKNKEEIEEPKSKKGVKKAESSSKEEVDEPKNDAVAANSRKRKADADSPEKQAKKTKRSYEAPKVPVKFESSGVVLSMGDGDVGQCGHGADVLEVSRPKKVDLGEDNNKIIQVAAGGMHSLCLTSEGEIYSFGCNDEATLGRETKSEEDCFVPGKVEGIEGKVVQVVAGDSHSAALTESGQVYIWGTFRDSNGLIGINQDEDSEENRRKTSQKRKHESGKEMGKSEKITKPAKILPKTKVIKIASGSSHILCLSDKEDMYSLGASDFGQLGRVPELFSNRGGRFGLDTILDAKPVRFNGKRHKCVDIWAGAYVSFAKTVNGEILSWGLNNYHQLGFPDTEKRMFPQIVECFDRNLNWTEIACAEHHTMALDTNGKVYCMGRKEYGRLGLGPVDNLDHVNTLTLIESLASKKCISIGCGSSVSFAVVDDGTIYGWGMGSAKQLGTGDDEDDIYVPTPIKGKQLNNLKGIMAMAGGMHTLLLASETN